MRRRMHGKTVRVQADPLDGARVLEIGRRRGSITYAQGDDVCVLLCGVRYRALVLKALPDRRYEVRLGDTLRTIPHSAIVKEADTGGIGRVQHLAEGRLI